MVFVKTYSGRLDANAAEDTNWTTREVTSIFNVFFQLKSYQAYYYIL